MKPLIQKLPLNENNSFVAQSFRTPDFEVGWHQHIEFELILFTEGAGLSFIGNSVGEFETNDVYLLGSNLPHTFQKREAQMIASAIVVQFKDDCWGRSFLEMPECRHIRNLLSVSSYGLKLQGATKSTLVHLIKALETSQGFQRVLLLGQCLDLIATSQEYITVSTQEVKSPQKERECIDNIFQYTIDNFRDPITLSQVADIACMSIPAFCNYFKKSTKKTYIDFLNEIRIGYACTLLMETRKTVLDICFDSGYNTMANFHKQFLKIKHITPLQYRKYFTTQIAMAQNNIHIIEE